MTSRAGLYLYPGDWVIRRKPASGPPWYVVVKLLRLYDDEVWTGKHRLATGEWVDSAFHHSEILCRIPSPKPER